MGALAVAGVAVGALTNAGLIGGSPPDPGGGTTDGCPAGPIPVTGQIRLSPSCSGPVQFDAPDRWTVEAVATGSEPCRLGLAATASKPARSAFGTDILVHGRDSGPHTIDIPARCAVTLVAYDDPVATLPLHLAPTAQGGAGPLFSATGTIRVTSGGPSRCNATLFDDTGTKIGHQATPNAPLDINVNGNFWIVAEQNDCTIDVTQA